MATAAPSRMGIAWFRLGLLAAMAAVGLAIAVLSPKVALFCLIMLTLLFLRQPVVLILAAGTAFVHAFFAKNSQVEYLMQDMWFTVDREVLLAIPMFLLAGALMTRGAIAQRLINVMIALDRPDSRRPGSRRRSCLRGIRGDLGILDRHDACDRDDHVPRPHQGRIRPGVLDRVDLFGGNARDHDPAVDTDDPLRSCDRDLHHAALHRRYRSGPPPDGAVFDLQLRRKLAAQDRARSRRAGLPRHCERALFAMLLPVLLMGGIYSGYFSPTESAAVSLVYALVVELFIHRELKLADYGSVLLDTAKMLGTLLPLIAIANSLNTILDYEGIAKSWVQIVQSSVSSPVMVMVGINMLLLIVGCLMDVGSAILIFGPLLTPIAKNAGFDPVHFGIIMTANLEIGYLTPPVGLNLIVAMAAFRESFGFICRAVIPFIVIMLAWLAVVCAWPPLTLHLVGR